MYCKDLCEKNDVNSSNFWKKNSLKIIDKIRKLHTLITKFKCTYFFCFFVYFLVSLSDEIFIFYSEKFL